MLLGKFGLDHTVTGILFDVPRFTDFVIVANTCFFLGHLGCRFWTLNELWKRLPAILLVKPGCWTKEEVVMLVECCRLLHSNLSNMLRMFSLAYGPVLMVLFMFLLFDMFYNVFIILYVNVVNIPIIPAVIIFIENFIFIVTLLGIATWTNIQKKIIISYLRSTRIIGLPEEIIEQVNFFMKQVSSYESYEMSAFGVFNYDLKFFLTITMTLFKFVATMIQLAENTNFKSIVDETVRVLSNHTDTVG
ncbi:uncharacterized protein LOC126837859 [Adelges cooleyi]|uniref:uncharacterized protein LOC126837859 n=1 Tax=Adelges cooleyi TaxID=133065 RepID=UPI00217FB7BF|nr:uncharacterized protein LOC126837859 [Adelges cooleyi]